MLRKFVVLAVSALVVTGSFTFTNLVIARGTWRKSVAPAAKASRRRESLPYPIDIQT
jgi:hypothetical protein